jgi:hypothetical protein
MEKKKNIKFQSIILVSICVAYNLYKLVHASYVEKLKAQVFQSNNYSFKSKSYRIQNAS